MCTIKTVGTEYIYYKLKDGFSNHLELYGGERYSGVAELYTLHNEWHLDGAGYSLRLV